MGARLAKNEEVEKHEKSLKLLNNGDHRIIPKESNEESKLKE